MFGIGAGEFIVILIVGLIVFGPSKLPEVGRALGKGLREFRKAQAALSQTLSEVDVNDKPKPVEKPADEKKSAASNVTADDIINLAKEKPIVKENTNEKSFNGNSGDVTGNVPLGDTSASVTSAGRSSDGVGK